MSGFKLPDKATFWMVLANNGTGGKTWSTPITVAARIANTNTVTTTPEGKNHQATKAFYTETAIPIGAYVAQGTSVSATPISGAQQVVNATSNSSMTTMNKALV